MHSFLRTFEHLEHFTLKKPVGKNPFTDHHYTLRVLLDSGSQRSYMTSNLKERLNFKPMGKEILNFNTFGNEKIRTRQCNEVQVKLKTLSDNTEINVLTFPKICAPLPMKLDVESYPHMYGLEIADTCLVTDS